MKILKITVTGKAYDVQVEEIDASAAPAVAPAAPAPAVPAAPPAPATVSAPEGEAVKCPMPGTIVSVDVSVGQKVSKGDILVVLEAMKMENEIMAPRDAVIEAVSVNKGDSVESGTVLVVLK